MAAEPVSISYERQYGFDFSVCTIVSNKSEYHRMYESFVACGFSVNTEYLIADNTEGNKFEAYHAIRRFLAEAKGRYIIIVHQDVVCMDQSSGLIKILHNMDHNHPEWAVCGNGGGNGYKNYYFHMDDNGRMRRTGELPARVSSLDENLLVIRNGRGLALSADISGFHFYGTDLCLIADILGYSCFVIPFMVKHLSSGNLEAMEQFKPGFIHAWGRKLRKRFIQTTCTAFMLSNSTGRNSYLNKRTPFFWVKAFERIRNIFKSGNSV